MSIVVVGLISLAVTSISRKALVSHLLPHCNRMAGLPPKRRRTTDTDVETLQRLLHKGSISTAGLATLLNDLRDVDLEDTNTSRKALRVANESLFLAVRHVIDMPSRGGTWEWELMRPNLALSKMVEVCLPFRTRLEAAFRKRPPTASDPWNLAIAFDEYTPGLVDFRYLLFTMLVRMGCPTAVHMARIAGSAAGRHSRLCLSKSRHSRFAIHVGKPIAEILLGGNKLQLDHTRTSMVLSYTFKEFGQLNMSSESSWITPVVVRHNMFDQVGVPYLPCGVDVWARLRHSRDRGPIRNMDCGTAAIFAGPAAMLIAAQPRSWQAQPRNSSVRCTLLRAIELTG